MELNYRHIVIISLFLGFCFTPNEEAIGQPIPVGDLYEDHFRNTQLLSDSTTHSSFLNRPVWYETYNRAAETLDDNLVSGWNKKSDTPIFETRISDYKLSAGFYDPQISNTYNNNLPYGENNGSAWYGKGHNTELIAGFFISSDFLTVTFRPQISHQENADFPTPRFIPKYPDGSDRYVAEGYLPEDSLAERIDRPFRFGAKTYTTFDLGHSSVRLHYKNLEAGISTEPLWWGPGVQYALVMSNNAAGVPHAFVGSRQPLKLPFDIGKFEFRWLMGWPKDSKYFDLNLEGSPNEVNRKEREMLLGNRIMHGLNFVYSPSFLDNFHVGISRIIHQYIPEKCSIEEPTFFLNCDSFTVPSQKRQPINPLDIFKPFPKPDLDTYEGFRDESHFQDQNTLSSIYFRWLWPESNTEIYGEYYRENRGWNLRDLLTQPQHSRAYTIGAQTILESNLIQYFKINFELNSLLPGQIDDVRPQSYIYTHKRVKQGHTNKGQVLGAAIGPGSTSQYLGIDGYFKNGKIGIFVQRLVENDHFHYEYYQRFFTQGGYKDQFRHRVNLNLGANASYQFNSLLFSGRFVWNKNFNYGRFNYGQFPISYGTREGTDIVNLHLQMSIRYLF